MGKGDWRRPSCIPEAELERRWTEVFGEKKLNCMSPTEREQMIQEKEKLTAGWDCECGQAECNCGMRG